MPQVNEWQNRPQEAYDPLISMDAIHYKIRENHQIETNLSDPKVLLHFQYIFF